MPFYNDLEPADLPADFSAVIRYRIYLDYTDEMLSYYSNAPQPSGYIIHSPREFSEWVDWAQKYDPQKADIRMIPLGLSEYTRTMGEFLEKV